MRGRTSDEVENVATGEVKIGEFRKVGKEHHLKGIVMNGVKIGTVGKVGKSENSETDEEKKDQDGREIVQVNHKRRRETHSRGTRNIGRDEEEQQHVICN